MINDTLNHTLQPHNDKTPLNTLNFPINIEFLSQTFNMQNSIRKLSQSRDCDVRVIAL